MSIRLALLAIGILLTGTHTLAQNSIWKKDVQRTIPFKMPEATRPDSLLVELLVSAAYKKHPQAYRNIDAFFTTPIPDEVLRMSTIIEKDTITVVDPVTGMERRISDHVFHPELITKYRLHETWTFDAAKCRTTIHFAGLAPAIDIYNDDSTYRATQPMFWMRYNDVYPMLASYDKAHIKKFSSAVWSDYIKDTTAQLNVKPTGAYTAQATRIVHILYPNDTIHYHLRDISPDTCYMESIINLIKTGKISMYSNNSMSVPLSKKETMKILVALDTVVSGGSIHWETNYHGPGLIERIQFNPYNITKYKLLEEWSFDTKEGTITLQIKAIAPLQDILKKDGTYGGGKPMFWIKFEDFLKTLPAYDIYHPSNTFAQKLWQSYFQTPEYVK